MQDGSKQGDRKISDTQENPTVICQSLLLLLLEQLFWLHFTVSLPKLEGLKKKKNLKCPQ